MHLLKCTVGGRYTNLVFFAGMETEGDSSDVQTDPITNGNSLAVRQVALRYFIFVRTVF